MKFSVKTKKGEEMLKVLTKTKEDVNGKAKGLADFEFKQIDAENFELTIDYPLSNFLFNMAYEKALKDAIKKFDPDCEFKKVKHDKNKDKKPEEKPETERQ